VSTLINNISLSRYKWRKQK